MKLLLIHLSDMHIKSSEQENPLLYRANQIAAAASSCATEASGCIIVVSGDIAMSGKPAEYKVASQFFSSLQKAFNTRYPSHIPTIFVLVPGNHDCDFSLETKLRQAILGKISPDAFDESIISTYAEVQAPFFEFARNWDRSVDDASAFSLALRNLNFVVDKQNIRVHLFNTALLSTLPEIQGALQFPAQLLETHYSSENSSSLEIAVLHHPYNWFEATNARVLRRALESRSDLILTGHEHEPGDFGIAQHHREQIDYLEGAVLQDSRDPNSSGFNVAVVEFDNHLQTIHHFRWIKEEKRYHEPESPITIPLIRNAARLKNKFVISDDFDETLNDVGVSFTHPAAERVHLDDVFVYPDLRLLSAPELSVGDELTSRPRLIKDNLMGFVIEHPRLLIVGSDKSGKTTLAKVLFRDLRKQGFVPLLLNGYDVKYYDEQGFEHLIEKMFLEQYQATDISLYRQLEIDNRCVVLDDFQLSRLNSKGRDKAIHWLEAFFSHVILLGDDLARFTEFQDSDPDGRLIWRYAVCEIMYFGLVKRSLLTKKWIFLGRHLTHNENDLQRQALSAERLIDDVIGKGLIPPYPFFILIILQQYEIRQKLDIQAAFGSLGYLYEALLTAALAQASWGTLDLDTQYSYLTDFARLLFVSKRRQLSYGEGFDWHKEFCERYGLRLDFGALLDNFTRADVLAYKGGLISFKYPYIYYYFVSRYFRDHIDTDEVRQHITAMASRLNHETSANILLFLTYLTRNPIVIKSILTSAAQLFDKYPQCDFIKDVEFLGNIDTDPPALVMSELDPEGQRHSILAEQDDVEFEHETNDQSDPDSYEQAQIDNDLDELLQLNVAFKTIQILGQILRNYPGSLTAIDKMQIAHEAYSLSLRTCSYFFISFSQDREDLITFFNELIRKQRPDWTDERVKSHAAQFVFTLCEGLAFVITKHAADSLGDEVLSVTFDSLVRSEDNISVKYIDLFVRLFYFRDFPEDRILSLYKVVRKKPFAAQLVRYIVWYYFYVMPAGHDLVESICTKLGIKIKQSHFYDQRPKLLPPA